MANKSTKPAAKSSSSTSRTAGKTSSVQAATGSTTRKVPKTKAAKVQNLEESAAASKASPAKKLPERPKPSPAAEKKTVANTAAPKKSVKKKSSDSKKSDTAKVATTPPVVHRGLPKPTKVEPRPVPLELQRPPVIAEPTRSTDAPLDAEFLEMQRQRLLELRDHFLDQMQGVTNDGLRSRSDDGSASAFGMHQADAGSDAYEKDFALSLLSQEQDALYEIDEALKRIEDGTYGICQMSGQPIPRSRLIAIPFARLTVECQAKFEKENRGRRRWETTPQFMDSADHFFEEESSESDDEERKRSSD